jgi:DNA end-binding protein Ku
MVRETPADPHASPALTHGEWSPTPRGRPSWSGLLRLSLVAVPVKAYAAQSTTATIHFNQLHANCGRRIQYQKRCPQHGPVDATAIVRGFPYAPDQYVIVESEELDQLRPAKDKALVLEHFLPLAHVDATLFAGRSLYLVPDGVASQHPYSVVAAALHQAGLVALGRVVLSAQRQLVLVRPVGRLLVLDVLHYPGQVRPAAPWEAELRSSGPTAQELQLAGQLVQAGSSPVDWSQLRDTTAEELAALVQAKLAHRPVSDASREPVAVLQLLDALKQSVAAVMNPPLAAPVRTARPSRRIAR